MRYRDLTEAPIADFQYVDKSQEDWVERDKNWGPNGSSFRDDDQKAVANPKWQAKLVHQFRNVIHPVNLYVWNQKFLRTYVNGNEQTAIANFLSDMDVWSGAYSPSDFQQTFGFLPPEYQGALNFVLVQNEGDERLPLTPWIVGHRMVHALLNDYKNPGRDMAPYTGTGHFAFEDARTMLSAIRHHWENVHKVDLYYPAAQGRELEKEMWATVTTLTSAKNKRIERSGEVIIELFTQFLFTGDFTIDLSCFEGKGVSEEQMASIRGAEAKAKHTLKKALDKAVGQLIVF